MVLSSIVSTSDLAGFCKQPLLYKHQALFGSFTSLLPFYTYVEIVNVCYAMTTRGSRSWYMWRPTWDRAPKNRARKSTVSGGPPDTAGCARLGPAAPLPAPPQPLRSHPDAIRHQKNHIRNLSLSLSLNGDSLASKVLSAGLSLISYRCHCRA